MFNSPKHKSPPAPRDIMSRDQYQTSQKANTTRSKCDKTLSSCSDPSVQGEFSLFSHQKKLKKGEPLRFTYLDLREAVMELFLSIKIRSDHEIACYSKTKFLAEKQEMKGTDAFQIIDMIKSAIELLMNMKDGESESLNEVLYHDNRFEVNDDFLDKTRK